MNVEFNPVQTIPYDVWRKIKSRIWSLVNDTIFKWTLFFVRKTRVAILKAFGANVEWDCSISGSAKIVDL